MTRCIALYKMDIVPQLSNSIVNEGEHNSMKSTYTVNAVLRFLGPLFHIIEQNGFHNGLLSSHPFLCTAKTASLCILSRAPYGPICAAQITGVASDLLEGKLRPFFLIPTLQGGKEGAQEGVEHEGRLEVAQQTDGARTASNVHTFAHVQIHTDLCIPASICTQAHIALEMQSSRSHS